MFQDSAGIPQVINGLLMQPLRALPLAAANFAWLLIFNYAMALIALILIPAEFALAWIFSAPLRTAFLRARSLRARHLPHRGDPRLIQSSQSLRPRKPRGCYLRR
jgi:hypothetical protein